MISVQDAQNHLLSRVAAPLPPELVALPRAGGRVLAEDLRAPFDVPPADNSAVDGYAIASADIPARGARELVVVAELAAGSVYAGRLEPGQALGIMTGAPMPAGADTVVPLEAVERLDDCSSSRAASVSPASPPRGEARVDSSRAASASPSRGEARVDSSRAASASPSRGEARVIRIGSIAKGANVRLRGEDVSAGTVVIEAGRVLRPQELGLLASLGLPQVLVRRRPRVAVLSTGDEVAEPGHPRRPGQIYDSNRFMLHGAIEQAGGAVVDLGIVPDDRAPLRETLLAASRAADVVISSGGVSVGAHDLVKQVLGEVGAIDFWQVAMQPGRPLAAGRIGDAHFFGLPGNPVASMLTFALFVRPLLFKLAGRRRLFPVGFHARATEALPKKRGRREFKRGVLTYRDGAFEVRTTGPQGSGIVSSMVAGNCLIVIEEERGDVPAGESVWVEPFAEC
jgi:molybdopterin molybdotransferase